MERSRTLKEIPFCGLVVLRFKKKKELSMSQRETEPETKLASCPLPWFLPPCSCLELLPLFPLGIDTALDRSHRTLFSLTVVFVWSVFLSQEQDETRVRAVTRRRARAASRDESCVGSVVPEGFSMVRLYRPG